MPPTVDCNIENRVARVVFNDPKRRNAMGMVIFDALETALAACEGDDDLGVVRLSGWGPVFSAGFDLGAAVKDPPLMGKFIERLSGVIRRLRRMPAPVVAAVEGAAIAGGCAMCSACDFVCASVKTRFGYPVLPLGVSPAVSAPTLIQAVGPGPARMMMLEGRLLTGDEAHRLGLVTHLADTDEEVAAAADTLCATLLKHGPHAMRVTKAWLNELDGSLDDARFDGPAHDTARAATGEETVRLLGEFWGRRKR